MSDRSQEDIAFMQEALKLAHESFAGGHLPVGAVIVANGVIRGKGRKAGKNPFLLDHAEKNAIEEAIGHLHSNEEIYATIYTTLEPCIMCFGMILNVRIDRIVYALEDPYGGATCLNCEHLPPRHTEWRTEVTSGVLREESRALFKKFFRATNNPFWKDETNPLVKLCFT